ncbi:MAG: hypothetical protein EOP88_14365 [Verrucomicrobiaceae bacterium]|nr:MAG: hypothetical protein EOP88_14365 [Verrucomicrobiaceae bacterium]
MLSSVAVVFLVTVGHQWRSTFRSGTGEEGPMEVKLLTRREREEKPKLSNPVVLELLRQEAEGKVDERQWGDIRNLSEADVKAAIMELGYPEPSRGTLMGLLADSRLRQMLFQRWGQLDPVEANTMAKAMFPEDFAHSRRAVIAAWIARGGEKEAWEAVREELGSWACTESVPGEVAEMIVASLSDLDDAAAFAAVMRLNDENSLVTSTLCSARADDALASSETRAAFLAAAAAHPEPRVLECAREWLFREWAEIDIGAAEAGLTALCLPKDDEQQLQSRIDSVRRDKEDKEERNNTGASEDEAMPISIAGADESLPSGNGEWLEAQEQVRKRWEKSPAIFVDFELRDETRQLMEQIPVQDLEIWLRTLRAEYDDHLERDLPRDLREMILLTVVRRGPGTLIRSLAEHPVKDWEDAVEDAMYLWTKSDPASVLKWLDGDVSESMKTELEYYRDVASDNLTRE